MAAKRRRSLNALDVWMNGERVATWGQHGSVQTLAYDTAWSTSAEGRPLSLSLPLLPEGSAHRGPGVAAYFENLLPDSTQIRQRIRDRLDARSTTAFDLLAEIGRDCAGAVQLVPAGADPGDVRRIDATPLDEKGVAEALRSVPVSGAIGRQAGGTFRISLAGAQEKTAFLWHDGQWCIAEGATPTTHLFKLPLGLVGNMRADMAASVENEWLCSELVRAFGIPVAQARIAVFEDQKALVVERFDRRLAPDNGWWLRLPQEDMCQAKGLMPGRKYEEDGGPGVIAIMELLGASESPDIDRRNFFLAQLVFWMLGATDGHAKNFSLHIGAGGAFGLTPLYDVISAYPIMGRGPGKLDPHKAKLAMAVVSTNRHYRLDGILRRHWVEMGRRCGIDASELIEEVIRLSPMAIAQVHASLPPGFPDAVSNPIFDGIRAATAKLART